MHADDVLVRARDAHGISIDLADDVLHKVVEWVSDPRYGARPIHRGITSMLVDPLARALLGATHGPGAHFDVTVDDEARALVIAHREGEA